MSDDEARRPGESFLTHRARLKAERQREPQQPASVATEVKTPDRLTDAPETPERPLTDADMPPLDSLTAESDFSQFLAEGVSDALRRAALRKLFHLPEFNVLDGMNEYDEDYTNFEKLGEVVTYHQRRMQAREAAERAKAEREAAETAQGAETEQFQATSEPDVDSEKAAGDGEQTPTPEPTEEPLDDDGDLED